MAAAGHAGLERQFEAHDAFFEELNQAMVTWAWPGGQQPTPDNSTEAAKWHEREVQLALTDLRCRDATDYRARRDARRIEVETQFFNDNRAALNALRDAIEQRRF